MEIWIYLLLMSFHQIEKIETFAVTKGMDDRVNAFLKKNIDEGRQAYIVCPLVEESEEINAKSVMELAEHYKNKVFTEYKVEYLHGKMKPKEKRCYYGRI